MLRISFVCLFALISIVVVGCGPESTPPKTTPEVKTTPSVEDGLSKLSPADQEAARKQIVCPVSEKLLGSMDKPVKVNVEGREVFICCDSCQAKLKEKPKPHLALLTDIQTALGKLSKEERDQALKQRICPVTEKALGSMDVPVKVSVAGQEVFICCKACEENLKEKPEEHLKKLKK